jgi:hypothetical protein
MIVTLQLTSEQADLLRPIVLKASAKHGNVVFVATAAPNNCTWRLQVTAIPARLGSKILQILKKEAISMPNSDVSRKSPESEQ